MESKTVRYHNIPWATAMASTTVDDASAVTNDHKSHLRELLFCETGFTLLRELYAQGMLREDETWIQSHRRYTLELECLIPPDAVEVPASLIGRSQLPNVHMQVHEIFSKHNVDVFDKADMFADIVDFVHDNANIRHIYEPINISKIQ